MREYAPDPTATSERGDLYIMQILIKNFLQDLTMDLLLLVAPVPDQDLQR